MHIQDLSAADTIYIQQTASIAHQAFPHAWEDLPTAMQEVQASLGPERISRVALDETNAVAGWIGGISAYDGHAWELHPLVVREDRRGEGIGSALVRDLETLVGRRGATTLYLGTDDEFDQTSLAGVDLYPDIGAHIARIRNLRRHPYEFYQKLGFVIVGVLPDANGPGKPDILMAKRVSR
jgi:aminoglycoside 6'-N-acetyltransferase I